MPEECFVRKDLIRVLCLHPGGGDAIFCSLDVKQIPMLDHRGRVKPMFEYGKKVEIIPYEALSYAWGTGKQSKDLFIKKKGVDEQYMKLKITESLWTALKTLRDDQGETKYFWADAVCMNQNDDEEKSKQLALMSRIYREARQVCVWLGKSDTDTEKAFKLIDNIRDTVQYNHFVESTKPEVWTSFAKLLMETWFSRRRVVQEISLATRAEIRCGQLRQPWENFSEAVSLFVLVAQRVKKRVGDAYSDKFGDIAEFSANQLVTLTNNVVWRDDEHRATQMKYTLEYLVSRLYAFEAGEPRDIIYAMLSLAADVKGITSEALLEYKPITEIPPQLASRLRPEQDPVVVLRALNKVAKYWRIEYFPVDYSKDFVDVCLDFLRFTTRKSGSLDLICRPWAPRRGDLKKSIIYEKTKYLQEQIDNTTEQMKKSQLETNLNSRKLELKKQIKEDEILPSWIRSLNETAFRRNRNKLNEVEDKYRWDRVNADSLVGLPGESTYNASRAVRGDWFFKRYEKAVILSAKGFALDVLGDIEPHAQASSIPRHWRKYVKTKQNVEIYDDNSQAEETISESFWRTIVASRAVTTQPPPYYRTLCEIIFNSEHDDEDINIENIRNGTENGLHKSYLKRVQAVIWGRSLKKLSRCGRLALVPESAKKGDSICILFGCSVPVVLRAVEQQLMVQEPSGDTVIEVDRKLYEFIGECYVDGAMEGEAFGIRQDAIEKDPKTLEELTEEQKAFYKYQYFHLR